MRILHLLNHTYRLNGNVHAAVDVACAQAKNGHMVAMCSGGGNFDQILNENNVFVVEIDQKRRPVNLLVASWKLFRFCRQWKPQLIHAHMMTSGVIAWGITRLLRIPLVTTVHNEFDRSAILMGLGDRVIAVSRSVKTSMIRRGISEKRMRVVLNGTIGSARFSMPEPKPAILHHPAILYVGGLHPRKGISDLVSGFGLIAQEHPGAHLYLVGEGPNRKEYEALAISLNLAGQVHFVGPLSDPRPYMKAADIFVLASHSDPAPLVLSEAREAGCAIIATDVDGIPQLLDNGAAGLLVPPGQPEAIAAALDTFLRSPSKLVEQQNRSRSNLETFTVRRVAEETINIYQECVPA